MNFRHLLGCDTIDDYDEPFCEQQHTHGSNK